MSSFQMMTPLGWWKGIPGPSSLSGEQVQLSAQLAVVTLFGFFQEMQILLKLAPV